MCIDSKKFVATADGKQIRLFPENYNVLSRERTKIWNLDLDPAIDEELAVEIFRAFHTNHNIRWGRKEIALETLNKLVGEPQDLQGCGSNDWALEEVIEGYHIWVRTGTEGKEVYQVTATLAPPTTNAGYYNREAMLDQKGLKQ